MLKSIRKQVSTAFNNLISSNLNLKHYVISIDSPDPDNQLMVLMFCKKYEKEIINGTVKLHVILTPRPVDLRYRLMTFEESQVLMDLSKIDGIFKGFNSAKPSWKDQLIRDNTDNFETKINDITLESLKKSFSDEDKKSKIVDNKYIYENKLLS
jgi:hypothetical protein